MQSIKKYKESLFKLVGAYCVTFAIMKVLMMFGYGLKGWSLSIFALAVVSTEIISFIMNPDDYIKSHSKSKYPERFEPSEQFLIYCPYKPKWHDENCNDDNRYCVFTSLNAS